MDQTQNKFYKTVVNGQTVYEVIPDAGNVPYGYTPITYADFQAGVQPQIADWTAKAASTGNQDYLKQATYYQGLLSKYAGTAPTATGAGQSGYVMQGGVPHTVQSLQADAQYNADMAAGKLVQIGTSPTGVPLYASKGSPAATPGQQATAQNPNPIDPATGKQYMSSPTQVAGTQATGTQPTPATPAAQTTAQTQQPIKPPPTVSLQPGMQGDSVKQLQDYLVGKGLMTQQDLMNGGYGIYGPKTTAAVAALQSQLGVDNSSGVGFYGPRTQQALSQAGLMGTTNPSGMTNGGTTNTGTPTGTTGGEPTVDKYSGMDPVQRQIAMYTDMAAAVGTPTIKQELEKIQLQHKELTDKMNKEKAEAQSNPWYSQNLVEREQAKIDKKYKSELETLSNLQILHESLYKEGMARVENMVSGAEADIRAMNELAQKKAEAQAALERDTFTVEANGRQLLYSKTGKLIADLGAAPSKTKDTTDGTPSTYDMKLADRQLASAQSLLSRVSNWTVGPGSLLSWIPATDATNFNADLDSLKANIAFGALAEMRAASKTGGALGAISERELALLESTLAGLNTSQSAANFKKNLETIIDSVTRWQQANTASAGGSTTDRMGNQYITMPDGKRYRRLPDGNYEELR